MTEVEKRVARELEGDIGVEKHPFTIIAKRCGTDEAMVIDIIRRFKEQGLIRRFGAVLRHREAGVRANALVMWAVPPDQSVRAGNMLATYDEVTHCYERCPPFGKKYNLFSMIHCKTQGIEHFVNTLSLTLGIQEYMILNSMEEFKKRSMEYFSDEQNLERAL